MRQTFQIVLTLVFPGIVFAQIPRLQTPNLNSAAARDHATQLLSGIPLEPIRFLPPPVRETKLKSGATLLVAEEDSLPFLTIELHFPGGTKVEKLEDAGLWDAAASLLTEGGAGNRNGDQIAEELSRMGARFSIHNDYESWVVTLTVLKWDFPRAFEILSDVLLRPRLAPDRLAVILDGMETDIDQRNNRPEYTGGRRLLELMYPGSRRGYSIQKSDLKKITPEKIRSELARRLYAGNVFVAAGGDLRGIKLESSLEGLLAQFPARSAPVAVDPPAGKRKMTDKILLVQMEVPQAAVAMGTILPAHRSEDFYALQIGNHILGGNSFNSRLMKEVRTARGLAYYSMSHNSFFEDDGRFTAASGTRVEQTDETVRLMLELIAGMQRPPEEIEMNLAKDSILNSLVFLYDDPESYLQSQVRFRLHGLKPDYLERYPEKIRGLSASDVSRAFARYVKSDVNIVITGPLSLKPALEKIRPVVVVGPESKIP